MSTRDDIEDSAAPLLEHLTELRSRLIYSVMAFLVGMIICFSFGSMLLDFLLGPIERTMRDLGNPNPVMQYTAPQEYFFTLVRVAMVAGLAIFPIVFANGLDPAEGPGLIFVSLPIAFGSVTGGLVFGTLFFILLFFAALTSVLGCVEPTIAWSQEKLGMNRVVASITACFTIFALGIGTVLSFNLWSGWRPLSGIERYADFGYFEILDYLTANIMMPVTGLVLALFVGWLMYPFPMD